VNATAGARPVPLYMVGHLTVDDVVLPDGATRMHQVGGAPVFAAVGARLAGLPATVVTAVAPSLPAEVAAWLAREEIPITDCGDTGRYITQWVLYEENGRRTFLHHPQSADLYEAAPDAALWPGRPGPGWAHIAPMPISVQASWVHRLTAQGFAVTLDPHDGCAAAQPGEILGLLPSLHAFLPSEQEAARLFGGTDVMAAAREFVAAGADVCAIKLGEAGCVVATGQQAWQVPSVAEECVDVTGAGDAFCGGFLAALARGLDPEAAARYGTAAASFAVEQFGVPSTRCRSPASWAARLARTQSRRLVGQPAGPHGRNG
jgi:sugar/nucleoside kinase (ribokinase family)